MMLAVTQETILAEMKSTRVILDTLIQKVSDGIPGVDIPAAPDMLADFMRSFCGELLIAAAKCENLSNVLAGEM